MFKKNHRKETYFYGAVGLTRVVCPECDRWCIVQAGKTPCCGVPIEFDESLAPRQFRSSSPLPKRKPPSKEEKREILRSQHFRCIYCFAEFGSIHLRNDYEEVALSVEFDHCIPFDYDQNNQLENYVASCQVCNRYKSDMHFRDMAQARDYLSDRRKSSGYDW